MDRTKIAICTRTMDESLTEQCKGFLSGLGLKHISIKDTGSVGGFVYFERMIIELIGYDWVVNIDEDAFVFRPESIIELVEYMDKGGYDFCGMPDGNMLWHRLKHRCIPNAFFNVINLKKLRESLKTKSIYDYAKRPYTQHRHLLDLDGKVPKEFHHLNKFRHPRMSREAYYPFFVYLLEEKFRPLYLDAREASEAGDNIACALCDHNGVDFLYHAWFGSLYGSTHRVRIDRLILASRARTQSLSKS
jgi:hypothetical protein